MTFLKTFLRLFNLVISLWLTASLVFIMSLLLPAASTPKGMIEAYLSIYGASDVSTLAAVRADYLERTGLNKPLFYFKILAKGSKIAAGIPTTALDRPWVERAVIRHGLEPTLQFYTVWRQWATQATETEKTNLFQTLVSWSLSEAPEDIMISSKQVEKAVQASPGPASAQLFASWKNLTKQSAPFHYFFPTVEWQGKDNSYHRWMLQIMQGNLGFSTQDYEAVTAKITSAAMTSLALAIIGLPLAVVFSFLAGLYLTEKSTSPFTPLLRQGLYVLDSIPAFLIALSILGLFLVNGGSTLAPFTMDTEEESILAAFRNPSILLGGFCVALLIIPQITLQFHRSLVTQTEQLYQRTGLAKGLTFQKTIRKHALPNALLPTLTILSEVIIGLMSGVLVVEITFSLPGIGSLLTKAILAADYPVLVGLTLMFLVFRLFIVWLTEMGYGLLDPRMRSN
ncbi:ABC transporter permease [Rufibacter sediminis]|uniref:ABC transporter permease n=1 Tax=Rufibacter sediminis TaxID=2762756 RepID=A0ABR6VYN6_9BACT|nr:ABC transporter permease [Rufibacter sediminis]MBC3542320.1 ABC transporter permease [Rufibacter sediminis]